MSWNVNGVKTKIEKSHVQDMLLRYDIISLNEIKTSLPISFPGYVSFKSSDKNHLHCGGTSVLLKQ